MIRTYLIAGLFVMAMPTGCVATSGRAQQTGATLSIAAVPTTQPVTASIDDVKQAVTATVGASVGRMEAKLDATVSAQADVAAVRGDLAAIKGDVAAVRTSQTSNAGRDVNNLSGWPLLAGVLGVVLIVAAARIVDGHLNRRQRERHVRRQWVGDS